MSDAARRKRRRALRIWRVVNRLSMPFAGLLPWWVVLETTGRKSGQPRRVPLARGPVDGDTAWLIVVHGKRASFARNIEASPAVRLKISGRWHDGTAALVPLDEAVLARFSAYARGGPRTFGIDPALLRIELNR